MYPSLLLPGYATIYETIRSSLPSIQARKVREYEQNIRSILSGGAREVVDKFPVDWEDVGVHAFLLRGLPPFRRLVNVGGVGELQLTADYKGIVARPIFATGGKLTGCVSIDALLSVADLSSPPMDDTPRDVAGAVVLAGVPPRAWWSYTA